MPEPIPKRPIQLEFEQRFVDRLIDLLDHEIKASEFKDEVLSDLEYLLDEAMSGRL